MGESSVSTSQPRIYNNKKKVSVIKGSISENQRSTGIIKVPVPKIKVQTSKIHSKIQVERIPVDANSSYNLFFRKLFLVQRFRSEYLQSLSQSGMDLARHIIIVKNFNPYFAMGFLKPNMKVHYYIQQFYKFEDPFKLNIPDDKTYANVVRAFTRKAGLIKQLIRGGQDIRNYNLIFPADDPIMKNIEVEFIKNGDITIALKAFGKIPIVIIDCTTLSPTITYKAGRANPLLLGTLKELAHIGEL
jgi:hypothetical protein